MGTLNLPTSGRVCVDTQIVIYTVDNHPKYAPLLRPMWEAAARREIEVVAIGLAEMESLVFPMRNKRHEEEARIKLLFKTSIRLLPVSRSVLMRAAELRAGRRALRTPDAIHLASADWSACELFVTNDLELKSAAPVPIALLDEVLAS